MTIPVLFEDNHILIVEKPVNIPVQRDESEDDDMLTLIKLDIKDRHKKPGNVYLGMVHRLDRPAGGVMVFAKTSKAASRLSALIRKGLFKKTYFAVVHGRMDKPSGSLKNYLIKDADKNIVRVSVNQRGAKEALLEYSETEYSDDLSLIKINLITGRPHQIRVQFSAAGHPLWGDQKYGRKINSAGQQLALWSAELEFAHPVSGNIMIYRSSPPDEYPWNLFGFFR